MSSGAGTQTCDQSCRRGAKHSTSPSSPLESFDDTSSTEMSFISTNAENNRQNELALVELIASEENMPITSAGTAVASEEESAQTYDLAEDAVTTTDCGSGSRAGCRVGGGGDSLR